MTKTTHPSDGYDTARSALRRVHAIHEYLINDRYPSQTALARRFEVSTKTIQRDVQFMKDTLALPINYDREHAGYAYSEAVTDMPAMKLRREELFALFVARSSIEKYQGTAFEDPLKSFFAKLLDHLSPLNLESMKEVVNYVTYLPAGQNTCRYRMLDVLSDACRRHKELIVRYQAVRQPLRQRVLQPYNLVNHDNRWYLFAKRKDDAEGDMRCYHLPRMTSAKLNGRTFERDTKFKLDKYLRNSFGIFVGEETYKVRVKFTPFAAPYQKERKWNQSQKIKNLKDGSVIVSLQVNHLTEVAAWILNWGGHAKVLSPKPLVELVKEELRKAAAHYGIETKG